MSWLPELFLHHPRLPWQLDATAMGLDAARLDGLDWDSTFREMRELEAGAVANADEGRQVGHYWLRAPERAPTVGQARAIGETAERVRQLAEQIRSGEVAAEGGERFTDVLHVGIGGSALGPALLVDALAGICEPGSFPPGGLRVHFVDNTDPDGIARLLDGLDDRLRTTLVVVVSKSGTTPETRNGMLLVRERLEQKGLEKGSRSIAITGEGSALDQLAREERWLATFPLWDWVGGRTSSMSAVGLLPAELAGVDTAALLSGARDMDEWTRTEAWRANPAALLAGCWVASGNEEPGDRNMVVLPYSDRLLLLSRHLQQLVMESVGKELDRSGRPLHQGLTVYGNKGSTDQHAFVQQLRDGRADFFACFLQILEDGAGSGLEVEPGANAGDYLQGFLLGTRRALADRGRPTMTITAPRVDAYVLGGLFALFERAVGYYGTLVDINAYHQPGVEAGKRAAKEMLDLSRRLRDALAERPGTTPELAARLEAEPLEILYLLERLEATGRARRDGSLPHATWHPGGRR